MVGGGSIVSMCPQGVLLLVTVLQIRVKNRKNGGQIGKNRSQNAF